MKSVLGIFSRPSSHIYHSVTSSVTLLTCGFYLKRVTLNTRVCEMRAAQKSVQTCSSFRSLWVAVFRDRSSPDGPRRTGENRFWTPSRAVSIILYEKRALRVVWRHTICTSSKPWRIFLRFLSYKRKYNGRVWTPVYSISFLNKYARATTTTTTTVSYTLQIGYAAHECIRTGRRRRRRTEPIGAHTRTQHNARKPVLTGGASAGLSHNV